MDTDDSQASASQAERITMFMGLLPPNARLLVEVEGRDGHLARRYRRAYPASFYYAVERSAERAALARKHAPVVHQVNVETAGDAFFEHVAMADGWIFDSALERLADPARVLTRIRSTMPIDACIVACVINGAYWNWQQALREDDHQQRYTLKTLIELLAQAGLRLVSGAAVVLNETSNPEAEAALRRHAAAEGLDPEQAWQDALPTHYLIKAVPA